MQVRNVLIINDYQSALLYVLVFKLCCVIDQFTMKAESFLFLVYLSAGLLVIVMTILMPFYVYCIHKNVEKAVKILLKSRP